MSEQEIINEIEGATDAVIETVVPEVAQAVRVVKNNPVVLVGVALVAASSGAYAGYFFAKKKLEMKYMTLLDEQIDAAREHYAKLNKADEFSTPEKAVQALVPVEDQVVLESEPITGEAKRAFTDYRAFGSSSEVVEGEDGSITIKQTETVSDADGVVEETVRETAIFSDGEPLDPDDWDYDAEVEKRTKEFPYIVTAEEFVVNEDDADVFTWVWFERDLILVDEAGDVIDDVVGAIGPTPPSFGAGTGDRNLVHIYNPKRNHLYEIARSTDSYMRSVHGMDEMEEPMRRRGRRGGDE